VTYLRHPHCLSYFYTAPTQDDIVLALYQLVMLGTALCYAVFTKTNPINNLKLLLLLHRRPLN